MIYLTPRGHQSLWWVGGWLLGPSFAVSRGLLLKSCSYLAVPCHVCVLELGTPLQTPQGSPRSLKELSGARLLQPSALPSPPHFSLAGVWNLPITFMEMDGQACSPILRTGPGTRSSPQPRYYQQLTFVEPH